MGRRDHVDVVTSLLLQVDHHLGKVFNTSSLSSSTLADLPVDTENAAQIAVGQKDGAGATLTTKGEFFPEVGMICRDLKFRIPLAEASLSIKPPGPALSGTKPALLHYVPQFFSSLFQLTTAVES